MHTHIRSYKYLWYVYTCVLVCCIRWTVYSCSYWLISLSNLSSMSALKQINEVSSVPRHSQHSMQNTLYLQTCDSLLLQHCQLTRMWILTPFFWVELYLFAFIGSLGHILIQSGRRLSIWCPQVDAEGDAWVAGYTDSSRLDGHDNAGGRDVFLMKFNAQGVHQWTRVHGGKGSDMAQALQADWVRRLGNIFHGAKLLDSLLGSMICRSTCCGFLLFWGDSVSHENLSDVFRLNRLIVAVDRFSHFNMVFGTCWYFFFFSGLPTIYLYIYVIRI